MGNAARVEKDASLESISYGGVTWVDVRNPTRKEIDLLAQDYPFHHLNLDDCISKIQLTKIDQHDDYLFILVHFPSYSTEEGDVVSNQISVFLGKDYLVSLHRGDKRLTEMFEECKSHEAKRQAFMAKSALLLLYHVLDRLVDDLFPMLDKVMDYLDEIEDKVFDERVSAMLEVNRLRRRIGDLRRIVFPLRRLILDLATNAQQFTSHDLSAYYSDIKDHIEKAWETLEEAKETIEIYKDTDFSLSAEKSNKILAVLTIIFTLTIPIVTIGTIYGMNVKLPGGIETGAWTFFGPYTTFLILLLAGITPSTLMAWYFRRRGWL